MNKRFYKDWKFWLGIAIFVAVIVFCFVKFSHAENYQVVDSVLTILSILVSAIMVVLSISSEKKENRVQAIREMKISNYMNLISAITYRHNDILNNEYHYDYHQKFVEEINKANLYASKRVLNMLQNIKEGKHVPVENLIYEIRKDVHQSNFLEDIKEDDLKGIFLVAQRQDKYRHY